MTLKPRGHLRVSSSTAISVGFLAQDLCEFQQQYPELSVELIHNDRAVHPIHESYDICFQVLDVNSEMVTKQHITPLRILLCASPQYLEKYGTPKHPNDLLQHRCAHNVYLEPKIEWHLTSKESNVCISPEPMIRTNDVWMMRDATCNGNCIAPLPVFMVEKELTKGVLIPILTDWKYPEFTMAAYYAKSDYVPLKTRLFLDFVMERYHSMLPWEKQLAKLSI